MPSYRNIAESKKNKEKLNVIILSAAPSRGMKTSGPIPIFSINNQTLLEKQVNTVNKVYPNSDIYVVIGYMDFRIRNKLWGNLPNNVRFVNNPIYNETNSVYSLKLALDNMLPGNVLVIHGDLVFNITCIKDIANKKSSLLVDDNGKFKKDKVGVNIDDGNIIHIGYNIKEYKWGQISFFKNKELRLLKKIVFNDDINKSITLFEAIKIIINNNGQFTSFCPKNKRIIEINNTKDLEKAKSI